MARRPPPKAPPPASWSLLGLRLAALWALWVAAAYAWKTWQIMGVPPEKFLFSLGKELGLGPQLLGFWGGHLARILAVLGFFAGARALGRAALKPLLPAASGVLAAGAGLALLSWAAFGLFALGLGSVGVFRVLFAALALAGAVDLFRRPPALPAALLRSSPGLNVLLCSGAAAAFLGTTMPEVFYDALVYHLAVPQACLQAGRFVDFPYNHYAWLPLLSSMTFSWGLAAGGMYTAKLMSFGVGVLLLAGMLEWSRELGDEESGPWACALFLGTPVILFLFWMCNSDLSAALYHLLAMMLLWRWRCDGCSPLAPPLRSSDPAQGRREPSKKLLLLAGLFAGCAMASKYSTAYGAAAMGLGLLAVRAPGGALLFWGAALLPLLPWWARAYLQTGNPFFPYLAQWLGGRGADLELLQAWYADTRFGSPGFAPWRHALKLWNDSVGGCLDFSFVFIGPLFLGLLPLALLLCRDPWSLSAMAFCALVLAAGLSQTYIDRLLTPYFVPWAMLLARGLRAANSRALSGLALAALGLNLLWFLQPFVLTSMQALRVPLGQVGWEEYLSSHRKLYGSPSYGAFVFARSLELEPGERVMVVGDARVFYAPGEALGSAPFDAPPLFLWASEAKSPEELWQRVLQERVKVVIPNPREFRRTAPAKYQDPELMRRVVAMLQERFEVAYEDEFSRVYVRKPI
ncbi:MAG TPA: hypothetical protein DCM05_09335 [Elusimicrobia bacterium]|nr:hypothetical protein [Elusimicrobiota bacterium]